MNVKQEPVGRTIYQYTMGTIEEADKLNPKTVSGHAHSIGMRQGEPLIIMMDCLLQYALVYRHRFDGYLADDSMLGQPWLDAAKGVRALLNGDGVVAMQHDITTDSKDNAAIESVFWKALEAAGFKESDL